MSEIARIIVVKPKLSGFHNANEHATIRDIQCVQCLGKGHHLIPSGYHGSSKGDEKYNCKVCEGSGKLKASIEITWTPDTAE